MISAGSRITYPFRSAPPIIGVGHFNFKWSKNMAVKQTIRTKAGTLKEVEITRNQAIALHCTECMGHEENPLDCTSVNCALYPFRKRTRLGLK